MVHRWRAGGIPLTSLMQLETRKGKPTPVIAKAPERGQVINLMDALKRSIDEGETKKPPAKSQSRKKAKTGTKAAPKAKKKKAVGAAG